MEFPGDRPLLRIGELSRRLGVSDHVLRAWENRYGLLQPVRSPGGFRLYSEADEWRIRRMQAYLADGLSAAEAARAALSGDASTPPGQPAGPPRAASAGDGLSAALRQALDAFDEPAAQAVLDRLLADLSVPAVLRDVVLPYLAELGERWQRGTASVAMEHFASNVIRGRLAGLARGWGSGHGPQALLACPPGELHDMALMVFGIVLHRNGWRIGYLGANTPVEELERAIDASHPDLVVLAATVPETLEPLRPELASLARRAPLALAGAGATAQTATAAGARLIGGRPGDRGRAGRVVAVKVLVAGASGFVGRRLCPALAGTGHDVAAMTRNPAAYTGAGTPVQADVHHPGTLGAAMAGCQAAYYLVHSLSDAEFERKDAAAAAAFGQAAARAGLQRIIYLGGLGDDEDALSAHLRSRREVEKLLGSAGVPVTVIRAGIIVGHGGISWELTRQLVEHLPAMITPRWVATRTQPIAVDDVVRYLLGVLALPEAAGRVFEAGGPEVLQYLTMLRRVAAIQGRPLPILPVPLLTPRLSSLWLTLVTDVDTATGRALIDSMTNEVIVRDHSIRDLIPFDPMPYDDAVRKALGERAQAKRDGR